MKTFLEFITEGKSLRERVQPAIEHTDEEGKVQIKRGKRGEDHAEIRERHMKEPGKPLPGRAGFYDPEEKKFYTREEMGGMDSTRMLTPKERDDREERLEKKYAGGQSSTDNMTDFQRTKQMLRYTEKLEEGNPLSQDLKHRRKGIHKIIISAARKNLSNKKNEERTKTLYKRLKASGAIFKKTKGVWQNSAGEIENEKSVMAHLPNDPTGEKILSLGHKLRRKYNQDAFIHRTPDGKGTAHNRDGSTDVYGNRTASNVDNPYGETRFRPTKPADKQPKITFTDEPEPKSRRGSFKKLK